MQRLQAANLPGSVQRIQNRLYGSPRATGRGHGSDRAVIAGLTDEQPESVAPPLIMGLLQRAVEGGELSLGGAHRIAFSAAFDLVFSETALPWHPNGMQLATWGPMVRCCSKRPNTPLAAVLCG